MIFIGVDILTFDIILSFIVEHALTFVSGIEPAASRKLIHRHEAMVLTPLTVEEPRLVRCHVEQVVDGTARYGLRSVLQLCDGMQRAAIGSHHLRHVASCYLSAGEQFKSSDDRVVLHRATLNDDVCAKVVIATKLEHFVEAVANDGVAQSGGNILDGSAFAHHLFDLRVHEDRAACA